jgi:hypothetical protein
MKIRHLPLLIGVLATTVPSLPVWAQASAPAPSASAVGPLRPVGPRLMTPAEKRANADEATSPDSRPDRPVVPQISIPFGKKPPPSASGPRPSPKAAPTLGVSDGAARCDAQPSDEERAACRKQQARVTNAP